MKNIVSPVVLWGTLFLFLFSSLSAQNSRQRAKDSLRLVVSKTEGAERLAANRKLVGLYQLEVNKDQVLDTILTIYDAMNADARKLGDLKEQGVILHNRLAAISSKGLYDEVIRPLPLSISSQRMNCGKTITWCVVSLSMPIVDRESMKKPLLRPTVFITTQKHRTTVPEWE